MKSTRKTTVRQVSTNTYRVSSSTTRSAATGKFVHRSEAPNRFSKSQSHRAS